MFRVYCDRPGSDKPSSDRSSAWIALRHLIGGWHGVDMAPAIVLTNWFSTVHRRRPETDSIISTHPPLLFDDGSAN